MYDWGPIKAVSEVFKVLLDWIHIFVPSYGWSIVLLTILFRGVLLPLDIKQKISMKKTTALQPKIAAINEKYKNDKEKAAQKTMELYKVERVSPFSGCLPSLIQLPLFFAFFGALQNLAGHEILNLYNFVKDGGTPVLESFFWVRNVWQPDTFGTFLGLNSTVIPPYEMVERFSSFKAAGITLESYNQVFAGLMEQYKNVYNGWFILPILSALSSFFMTKMTMPAQPATPAPQQQGMMNTKVMQYMFPVMSLFFTATANSVFGLYWITSNLWSMGIYYAVDRYWARKQKKLAEVEAIRAAEEARLLEEKKAEIAEQKARKAAYKQKNNPKGGQ